MPSINKINKSEILVFKSTQDTLMTIIVFMFLLFIPIDMANGILLRNDYMSISVLYKTVTLFLVMFYLVSRGNILKVLIVVVILNVVLMVHIISGSQPDIAISSLNMLIKYMSIIIFYFFFVSLIYRGYINLLFYIGKISFIFLILNMFIGLIGFGYPMYGSGNNSIGTRGLIYAGNELGTTMLISSILLIIYYLEHSKYRSFFIISILFILSSMLLTSKVSLLSSFLVFLFLPLVRSIFTIKKFKLLKIDFIYSSITIILGPVILLGIIFYILNYSGLMVRISYFYDKLDLLTMLLSGRNLRVIDGFTLYMNDFSLMEQLFGSVKYYISTEIDFFDFLFMYGIFGILLSYGLVSFYLIKQFFKKYNPYNKYLIFSIVLLLAISFTGGHLFYSGTAGFLISILMALGHYDIRKDNL